MSVAAPLSHRRQNLVLTLPGLLQWGVAFVALADALFWDRRIGLSLPLFLAALAGFTLLTRATRRGGRRGAVALVILALGLAPMIENLNLLSLGFGFLAVGVAVEFGHSADVKPWRVSLWRAAGRLIGGPCRVTKDVVHWSRAARRRPSALPHHRASLIAWVVPLVLLAVFIALFDAANPVIDAWLAEIPLPNCPDVDILGRVGFWLVMLVAIWPMIRARRSRRRPQVVGPNLPLPPLIGSEVVAVLLTPAAILRSLILFNLLFGLQLTLDGAYLWGGMALPEGMTYAAYAHRGAYPLVVTALLAGGFVLLVRPPGASAPARRLIAVLAVLFTGQNVLLMVSSMRRLALYVEAYSLTPWRVAAFIWMVLVAIGLFLIMLQVAFRRDNAWLVRNTAIATVAILYGCCFFDSAALIASYNVAHCLEMLGTGPTLDLDTMMELGPAAIPALDLYVGRTIDDHRRESIAAWREACAHETLAQAGEWRAWSVRAWRLKRYLDTSVSTGSAIMTPDRTADRDRQDP